MLPQNATNLKLFPVESRPPPRKRVQETVYVPRNRQYQCAEWRDDLTYQIGRSHLLFMKPGCRFKGTSRSFAPPPIYVGRSLNDAFWILQERRRWSTRRGSGTRSASAVACAKRRSGHRASSLANRRSTAPSATRRSSPPGASSAIRYWGDDDQDFRFSCGVVCK